VHPALRVGGPASAAAAWIGELLDHAATSGAAVDFLSTHTYGNAPLDVRAEATSRGRGHVPVWWTEWGITPRHFNPISDTVFGAPFVARGMKAASGRSESLAYWVVSDHFEELGTPEALFHGGFGLLTVGNLRKPQFWALHLLERLGDEVAACTLEGDGADSLVQAWASRDRDGRVAVAIWNGTLDQARGLGDPLLERSVTLVVDGLGVQPYVLRHLRVDDAHSNIVATWGRMGGGAWPDTSGWERLHAADTLDEFEPAHVVVPGGGRSRAAVPAPDARPVVRRAGPAGLRHAPASRTPAGRRTRAQTSPRGVQILGRSGSGLRGGGGGAPAAGRGGGPVGAVCPAPGEPPPGGLRRSAPRLGRRPRRRPAAAPPGRHGARRRRRVAGAARSPDGGPRAPRSARRAWGGSRSSGASGSPPMRVKPSDSNVEAVCTSSWSTRRRASSASI
jgi:hypothetical protein